MELEAELLEVLEVEVVYPMEEVVLKEEDKIPLLEVEEVVLEEVPKVVDLDGRIGIKRLELEMLVLVSEVIGLFWKKSNSLD